MRYFYCVLEKYDTNEKKKKKETKNGPYCVTVWKNSNYRNLKENAIYSFMLNLQEWAKPPKVIENDRAKILLDFQIQTDKVVVAD